MKQRRTLRIIVWLLVIVLAVSNLLAALDGEFWVFELFAHFVMQYIWLSLLLLPVVLWMRKWRLAVILVLIVAINSAEVATLRRDFSQPETDCDSSKTITILQSNVFYRNWNLDGSAKQLRKMAEQADIVVFNEFDVNWRAQKEGEFAKMFPHHYVTWIKGEIEKFAIFSREPFEVQQVSGRIAKNAHLRLLFPSYGLTLVSYHGLTPISASWTNERNHELLRIARDMKKLQSPALVLGDFNQTPYTLAMQKAMREGELQMAHFPHGLMPTWPSAGITFPLQIPIDHLLVNRYARICKRKVIDVAGSDHSAVRTIIQPIEFVPDFRAAQ
jgi:endonuclease/exonuclease/phosphatase (EEP) superfamily protein YafD